MIKYFIKYIDMFICQKKLQNSVQYAHEWTVWMNFGIQEIDMKIDNKSVSNDLTH